MNVSCYKCKKLYNMILEKCPHCGVYRHEVYEIGKEIGAAIHKFGLTMYNKGKEAQKIEDDNG